MSCNKYVGELQDQGMTVNLVKYELEVRPLNAAACYRQVPALVYSPGGEASGPLAPAANSVLYVQYWWSSIVVRVMTWCDAVKTRSGPHDYGPVNLVWWLDTYTPYTIYGIYLEVLIL